MYITITIFMHTTLQPGGVVATPSGKVDLRPPSYLILSIIVTINCTVLLFFTLIIGIPAIFLSVMVRLYVIYQVIFLDAYLFHVPVTLFTMFLPYTSNFFSIMACFVDI